MRRLLIAECKQEISSFNPVASRLSDFRVAGPQTLFSLHRGVMSEIAGALSVFEQRSDLELVPGCGIVSITSGGLTTAEAWQHLADQFLSAVRAAGPLDAVYFSLHGAMAADGQLDPEGYLLTETRKIVGDEIPLVASFDLHGIITDQCLAACDAISIYHTYPHVDFYQTGERAAKLLLRIIDDGVRPVTVRARIPALVRGDNLITATGLFGRQIRACQAIEAAAPGLSAGMFIGNPFTDVPDLCSNVIICTDDDEAFAREQALTIAADFWSVRDQLQAQLTPLSEAVRQVLPPGSGTTILVDAADATSSGASGDSNAIVRELVAQGYRGTVLAPIVDAPAVAAAFAAGVGARISCTVGGALDSRFTPLPIEGTVRLLSDGSFRNESDGATWRGGPTAVIEADNLTLIVTSRPVSLYDRSLFMAHGCQAAWYDVVIVKSPHCQKHMFKQWAARYINVDAPGSTSANLPSLGHTICRRPVFPLDPDVTYTPELRVFRRAR